MQQMSMLQHVAILNMEIICLNVMRLQEPFIITPIVTGK